MQITNQIHFRNLQGDILGGLTAAVVALPMALAFGIASGAGASAGLWGAILVGFFAALFGGTPSFISEPTGPMTVIVTAVITGLTANNPENGLAMAFTVVMMAGVVQIIFGLLRLGRYITMLPYNVISGFMTGIGVILIFMQISPFLGQETPKGGVFGVIQNLPTLITNINPWETFLGAITLAILFFYPSKLKKVFPPQLVALVIGTAISLMFFSGVEIRKKLFAQDRETVEVAYAGDVVGLNNPGSFAIGDTVCVGEWLQYPDIPSFSPELFAFLKNADPTKYKNFNKGVSELQEEGAIQILNSTDESKREPILAAVGQLQFEVVQFRLAQEYGVETRLEALPYAVARWVVDGWEALEKVDRLFNTFVTKDRWNRPVLLFKNQWNLEQVISDFPKLQLSPIALAPTG